MSITSTFLKQYKGGIKEVRSLTTQSLQAMSREQKIATAYRASDALRKNIANIQKAGLTSPLIERRKREGKPLPKALSISKLSKMSNTQLDKTLIDLSYTSKAKTSTVSGVKKFYKDFKEKTGVDYSSVSSDTWDKIRRAIESTPYTSDELIAVYSEFDGDEEEVEKYLQEKYGDYDTEELPYRK